MTTLFLFFTFHRPVKTESLRVRGHLEAAALKVGVRAGGRVGLGIQCHHFLTSSFTYKPTNRLLLGYEIYNNNS